MVILTYREIIIKKLSFCLLLAVLLSFYSCALKQPSDETIKNDDLAGSSTDVIKAQYEFDKIYIVSDSGMNKDSAKRIETSGKSIPTVNELKDVSGKAGLADSYPTLTREMGSGNTFQISFLGYEYIDMKEVYKYLFSEDSDNVNELNDSEDEYIRSFTSYTLYESDDRTIFIRKSVSSGETVGFHAHAEAFPEAALNGKALTTEEVLKIAKETAESLGKNVDKYDVTIESTESAVDPSGKKQYVKYSICFKRPYSDNITVGYSIGVTDSGYVYDYSAYRVWYKETGYGETMPDGLSQKMDKAVTEYITKFMPEGTEIAFSQDRVSREYGGNGDLSYSRYIIFYIREFRTEWNVLFVVFIPEAQT